MTCLIRSDHHFLKDKTLKKNGAPSSRMCSIQYQDFVYFLFSILVTSSPTLHTIPTMSQSDLAPTWMKQGGCGIVGELKNGQRELSKMHHLVDDPMQIMFG